MVESCSHTVDQNSTFTNNIAAVAGGVIDTYYGSVDIMSSTFTHNTAAVAGGVMYTKGGLFNISSSACTNNTADQEGGVMYTYNGSFSIMSSNFTNNTAAWWGGVMHIYQSGSGSNITSSTFNNTAISFSGGVMHILNGSVNIMSGTFSNNTASIPAPKYYFFHSVPVLLFSPWVLPPPPPAYCECTLSDSVPRQLEMTNDTFYHGPNESNSSKGSDFQPK